VHGGTGLELAVEIVVGSVPQVLERRVDDNVTGGVPTQARGLRGVVPVFGLVVYVLGICVLGICVLGICVLVGH
jgi:hypothetical protein